MKNEDLVDLFRTRQQWEDVLNWHFKSVGLFGTVIIFTNRETGEKMGEIKDIEHLDAEANKILDNIFEKSLLTD